MDSICRSSSVELRHIEHLLIGKARVIEI